MTFVISGVTDKKDKEFSDSVSVSENEVPTVRILNYTENNELNMFKMGSPINIMTIMKFIEDFDNGIAKRYMKSEEIPSQQNNVSLHIVGSNFQKIVIEDNTRDVLVLFSERNKDKCRHCDEFFTDVYEPMAKDLLHNNNLLLTFINYNSNEIDSLKADKEIPFLFLYRKDDKKNPIEYRGHKSKYVLIEWLMEHTTDPISKYPKYD